MFIPEHILEQVRPWNPVRTSVTILRNNRGWGRDEIWPCIVYFWDAEGREIGYWVDLASFPEFGDPVHIFAPAFREWHPSILESQQFEEIV